MKSLAPALCLLLAGPAAAATIDGVSADGTTVSLRLSKDEQASLKPGDTITLQPRTSNKAPVEGKITAIKAGKATVSVKQSAARTAFRSGGKVNVASAGAATPMVSTPKPAPAAAAPAPRVAPTQPDEGFADGSQTFENDLNAFAFESPAQLYQARQLRTDASLAYESDSDSFSAGGTRTEITVSGARLAAAAVYPIPRTPHRVSFAFSHFGPEAKIKDSVAGASNAADGSLSDTRFTPGGSFAVNDNVSIGAFYQVVQMSYDGGLYRDHELSITYGRPELGGVWHVPGLEAGLTFQPAVNEESHATDATNRTATGAGVITTSARVSEPTTWTAHGQMQLGNTLTAFGSVAFNMHNFNNVDGESAWDNNLTLKGGAEKLFGDGLSAGGTLSVDTPAMASEEQTSYDNILTWHVGGDFAKTVGAQGKVGAQLLYTVASDDYKVGGAKASVARDGLALAVTGSVKM